MMATDRIKELTLPGSIVLAAATIAGTTWLKSDQPAVDPNAVTIGEMNRTMVRMDATLTALNQKLDPLADRVSRLEFWKEAVSPVLVDHGAAIKALQATP